MADHDRGYKLLFPHPEMIADLPRDFFREEWVRDLDPSTLEQVRGNWAFAVSVIKVLLPVRVPGAEIPEELADPQEVKSMLAESVKEWTHQWKQEGIKIGQEDALAKARGVLLRDLEGRFGPLPDEVRRRVDAIASIEELTEFVFRAGAAPSLTALAAGPK